MKHGKILLVFAVVAMIAVAVSGCAFLFGSSEADITSFSITGETGAAVINTEDRSVVISFQPMDLSAAEPTIGISDGATLGTLPAFLDGQAVEVTVTAENGDAKVWSITVNIEYGIAFLYEGEARFLSYGYKNEAAASYTAEDLGSGVPVMLVDTATSPVTNIIVAGSKPKDAVELAPIVDGISFTFSFAGDVVGNYDMDDINDETTQYNDTTVTPAITAETDVFDVDAVFNIVVTAYGALQGDIVTGSFDTILSADGGVTYDQDITEGFFKVIRGLDF